MRRTAKFGYTVESTGVQIVEIEAALIVGLYSEYLDGKLSTCKLAKKLNEQEIKYYENGNEWNTKAVSR
ncbi:MAG: recombinase family protein, partial [Clostridia bacterium]|nr:recombinase family protein [Clostridia bacterium]